MQADEGSKPAPKPKAKPKAAGGIARAKSLSAEARSAIARKGAYKKAGIPSATHAGEIRLGDLVLQCAVLEDGRRVLTQSDVMVALGRARQVKSRKYFDADVNLPAFLQAKNLKPYITNELEVTSSRIEFVTVAGAKAFGYQAELLPKVCEVFIDAERADALNENQRHIADRAHLLYRGFATLGIIALVDEATGYQAVRDRDALQALLDQYLLKEHAAWAKRFPDEFYQQMFRLKSWKFPTPGGARPGVVGKYTLDIVYERLAPGLVDELKERNPKTEAGHRKSKHHQWLTDDVGHPALTNHIHAVMGLMRASKTWDAFKDLLDMAFPKKGTQFKLAIDD
jgi:hypothetical protein